MKNMKKIVALLLATVMVMAMSISVSAQTVHVTDNTANTGSIVISNAANSETYGVIKLFSATVSDDGKSIAYTGDIPAALATYFSKDDAGNITATDAAWNDAKTDMSDGLKTALKTWADGQTPIKTADSDGTELTFDQMEFGYYVVTTTQGEALVSVDSTNPTASIIDKNTTPPVNNLKKSADKTDVNIGDTVTYTVEFETANYDGTKQIIKYEISDAPAANSLTNINVTSITVGGTAIATQQFDGGKITINWTENGVAGKSLYGNGDKIVITYTAVVADTAAVDGAGNTNTVTIKPILDDGTSPEPSQYTETETFYTYAIALKKVDQSGQNLAGAKFQFPFYVKEAKADDGAYVYAGTAAGDGLVNEIETPADGLIIVKGVKTGPYSITETKAPDGYNKLSEPVSVTATKTGETTTSTTTYLDADGNIVDQQTEGGSTVTVSIEDLAATPVVVVNKTGAELPSTGGIGTTMFYVVGSVLVIGAAVVLISKRRMTR